ncbi:MAG: metal ABC transporter permease [Clostridia bacterium]|nr:metal ABC transporter permease [Clostridia bacterium]
MIDYFINYSFVRYAVIAGVLISLCSSMLGVTLVLKRYSYIGDGLSHVAFGGLAIAAALNFSNNLILVMPLTVLVSVMLIMNEKKGTGDSSLAMISVSSMAMGYLIFNVFPSANGGNISGDVCTSLFGSTAILTLSGADITLCLVMAVIVIVFFILFYNRIFAVTFDETFAYATGVKTKLYKLLIAVMCGVVISISMRLVGSLLVSALVVFPAMSAMKIFKSFKAVMICSGVISVAVALIGFALSISFETPVGATIVATDAIVYLIFAFLSKATKRG